MIDANRLDLQEIDGTEILVAIENLDGELQAAANWIDDAFGEIEMEAARFAPMQLARSMAKGITALPEFLRRPYAGPEEEFHRHA